MVRRQLVVGAAVLGGVAALGLPLGLLWWLVAPRPVVTVTGDGKTVPLPLSEIMFASEGFYAVIALCAGVACGYCGYLAQYRYPSRDGADFRLACLLGLLVGSVAGALIVCLVGTGLDARGFARAIAEADPGDEVEAGLRLQALGLLVVWPFAAVMQYALFDAVSMWRRDLPHESRLGASEGTDARDGGSGDHTVGSGPAST